MNVVMLAGSDGTEPRFVEVQGTAEGVAFSRGELDDLLDAGRARHRRGVRPPGRVRGRTAPEAMRAPARTRGAHRYQLVCSSANPDKVAEIAAIVGDVVDLLPRPPEVADVVEDADTLEGNARLKAVALVRATGLAAVADDTGLFVDALGGAPGVWSARATPARAATDTQNRAKLLQALAGRPEPDARRTVHDSGAGALAGRAGAERPGCLRGWDRAGRAGCRRLRVRPAVRASRGRRPHVRRDDGGGEARAVTSWARVPCSGRRPQALSGLTSPASRPARCPRPRRPARRAGARAWPWWDRCAPATPALASPHGGAARCAPGRT